MAAARAVDESTFEEVVLQSSTPVLVDFWADWCGPCRALSAVLDDLAETHAGRVEVVKVDVDANQDLAARYRVTSLPALKLFSGGEVVHSISGAKPRPVIESELAPFLT